MSNTPVIKFLDALYQATGEKAKPSGKGWSARCPVHDDGRASLSIAEGDNGGAVLHCHAGCKPAAVVAAIGLTMADLMPADTVDVDVTRSRPKKAGVVSTASRRNGKSYPMARDAVAELDAGTASGRRSGPTVTAKTSR